MGALEILFIIIIMIMISCKFWSPGTLSTHIKSLQVFKKEHCSCMSQDRRITASTHTHTQHANELTSITHKQSKEEDSYRRLLQQRCQCHKTMSMNLNSVTIPNAKHCFFCYYSRHKVLFLLLLFQIQSSVSSVTIPNTKLFLLLLFQIQSSVSSVTIPNTKLCFF